LKSEIDSVYEQVKGTRITYQKIVEDTISEILVIQQTGKYKIKVNEHELNEAVLDYQEQYPTLYNESLAEYGEQGLRRKLKDSALFGKMKTYAIQHLVVLDDAMIDSFKGQPEFQGHLDNTPNPQIFTALKKEIQEYAFGLWMSELKKGSQITYID
jgi:hypothetical protein